MVNDMPVADLNKKPKQKNQKSKHKLNHLLSALTSEQFDQLMPELELVELEAGSQLNAVKGAGQYMHFPLDCVVGMYLTEKNSQPTPIATTGNEGAVGISLSFLGEAAFNKTEVISAGHAYRLSTETLSTKYRLDSPLQQLLLRYSQILITQMQHGASCRRNHTSEQQLCRWLLASLDRLPSLELQITQQMIANKLGMALDKVIETTQKLQGMGLIDIGKENIVIHDRRSIEARACDCYAEIKRESARWLS